MARLGLSSCATFMAGRILPVLFSCIGAARGDIAGVVAVIDQCASNCTHKTACEADILKVKGDCKDDCAGCDVDGCAACVKPNRTLNGSGPDLALFDCVDALCRGIKDNDSHKPRGGELAKEDEGLQTEYQGLQNRRTGTNSSTLIEMSHLDDVVERKASSPPRRRRYVSPRHCCYSWGALSCGGCPQGTQGVPWYVCVSGTRCDHTGQPGECCGGDSHFDIFTAQCSKCSSRRRSIQSDISGWVCATTHRCRTEYSGRDRNNFEYWAALASVEAFACNDLLGILPGVPSCLQKSGWEKKLHDGGWVKMKAYEHQDAAVAEDFLSGDLDAVYLWTRDNGVCILAFAGSNSVTDFLADFNTDTSTRRAYAMGVTKTYYGLEGISKGPADELDPLLTKIIADSGGIKAECTSNFIVTGHSLGGAMAGIFAGIANTKSNPLSLSHKVDLLYTYGPMPASTVPIGNGQNGGGCFAGARYMNVKYMQAKAFDWFVNWADPAVVLGAYQASFKGRSGTPLHTWNLKQPKLKSIAMKGSQHDHVDCNTAATSNGVINTGPPFHLHAAEPRHGDVWGLLANLVTAGLTTIALHDQQLYVDNVAYGKPAAFVEEDSTHVNRSLREPGAEDAQRVRAEQDIAAGKLRYRELNLPSYAVKYLTLIDTDEDGVVSLEEHKATSVALARINQQSGKASADTMAGAVETEGHVTADAMGAEVRKHSPVADTTAGEVDTEGHVTANITGTKVSKHSPTANALIAVVDAEGRANFETAIDEKPKWNAELTGSKNALVRRA